MNSTLLINLSSVIDKVSHKYLGWIQIFHFGYDEIYLPTTRDKKFIEAIELTIEYTWRSL